MGTGFASTGFASTGVTSTGFAKLERSANRTVGL